MATAPQHNMVMTGAEESGAEEWRCPRCGRRLLLRWRPLFQKLVLEPGDERVRHVGAKGGVAVGPVDVDPGRAASLPADDARWLADNGMDG
jgi:hypothetical protein